MFVSNLDKILLKLHSLPYLSHLHLYSVKIQLLDTVKAIFRIKSLQHLRLYSFDPILLHFDDNSISPLAQLEYLSIDACYVTDFVELMKYVGPSLKRMNVSFHYQHLQNLPLIDPLIIDRLLCDNSIPSG